LWLSDGEKIMKLYLLVLTKYTNVTDTQTDGWTDRHRTTAWATLMHSIAWQKLYLMGKCEPVIKLYITIITICT